MRSAFLVDSSLTPVPIARKQILAAFASLESEQIALADAPGRVLSEPISSPVALPAFDNASMDGFAVVASDVETASPETPTRLNVIADLPAGKAPGIALVPGAAVRIMTGAALPPGADAVVPVEDTDVASCKPGTPAPDQVKIYRPVRAGTYIRSQGQDVRMGERILPTNHRLRPQDVAVCAMLGLPQIAVYRRPRVAMISPGDELLPVGAELAPGKIYESNSYLLRPLITHEGAEFLHAGIISDDFERVRKAMDQAVDKDVDLILSTGAVSMGAYDFVRVVLEQEGSLDLWRVNMRPGRPLAFGSYRGIPYFGLPGNPVSAYVVFQVFVRPVLRKMVGLPPRPRIIRKVELQDEVIQSDGRESYLRAVAKREDGRWVARLTGHQGSGNLRSLVQANALLIIPAGVTEVQAGSKIDAWFFDGIPE